MASVTALNGQTGSVILYSPDNSLGISLTGGDTINLIVDKTGSQGGVTSLQALIGPLTFTSAGHSVVITTPTLYPSGTTINLETSSTGLVGITTINGESSDPASHNFSISGSGNLAVATGGYGLVISDTSPAAVETINNLQPIANNIEIYGGVDISVTNAGNSITIDYTGGAGGAGIETINGISPAVGGAFTINPVGVVTVTATAGGGGIDITVPAGNGFVLDSANTITYVGANTSSVTAPCSVFVSGTEPNIICSVQLGMSNTSTVSAATPTLSLTIPLPTYSAVYLPKYSQSGTVLVTNAGSSAVFLCPSYLGTNGELTIDLTAFTAGLAVADTFFIEGLSLTFPIIPTAVNDFEFGIAGENLKDTYLPYTEPSVGSAVTLTVGASSTLLNTINYGVGSPYNIISGVVYSQQYTVSWSQANSVIYRYETGTATMFDNIHLSDVLGLPSNELEMLAITCSLNNDDCMALTWNQMSGNVVLYNVFNNPVLNYVILETGLGYAPHVTSISRGGGLCAIAYEKGFGFATMISTLVDVANTPPYLFSTFTEPSRVVNHVDTNDRFFVSVFGESFFTQRNLTTNAVTTQYNLSAGYVIDCFLGIDAWTNLLISTYDATLLVFPAQPFIIRAWSIAGATEEYSITGNWSVNGRPMPMISIMPLTP